MIADNLRNVKENIEKACKKTGRDISEVKLIAVTKTHPVEILEEVLALGVDLVGENKIQEAERKLPELSRRPEFHFIGHLQSNKIKKLIPLKPALIHSLDKLSTAEKLSGYLVKNELKQDVLIQINTTDEGQKSGINETEAIELVREIAKLPNIQVRGLMTIGMLSADPENNRKYFKALYQLREQLKQLDIPNVNLDYLSMGMSDDYMIAIEEGANLIRVGSAIFGRRNYNKEQQ